MPFRHNEKCCTAWINYADERQFLFLSVYHTTDAVPVVHFAAQFVVRADKNLDVDLCQGEFPSMQQRIEGELVELLSQDPQASMSPHKKNVPLNRPWLPSKLSDKGRGWILIFFLSFFPTHSSPSPQKHTHTGVPALTITGPHKISPCRLHGQLVNLNFVYKASKHLQFCRLCTLVCTQTQQQQQP